MPRGHSSKLRACEKHRQARSDDYSKQDAQATLAEKKEKTPSFSPICRADIQCSSVAESLVKCKTSQKHTAASVSALCIKYDEDAKIQDDERPSTSWALSPTSNSSSTVREEIAVLLVQFMLQKYSMREPITKEETLKHVILQSEDDFPEILKKVSELMVLTFGIDIKEIDPTKQRYALVSIISPNGGEILNGKTIQPRSDLLMMVLCLIFMNSNCVNEDFIREVLSVMRVYARVNHSIHGNIKKLITKDFVSEGFLEYRQGPIKGSPCHQYLWGPWAQCETNNIRVLECLAKIHNTVPTAFPSLYQEALRDEQERMQGKFVASSLGLMASDPPNDNSSNSSNLH